MKKQGLTPVKLRLILSIMLFVTIGVSGGLFYFANSQLTTVANDVSHTAADAKASQNNIQALQTIQKELIKQQNTIKQVDNITADSQSYNYQNQIINDLNTYANRSGITITNIDFAASSSAASGGTSAPSAAAPAAGSNATTAPAGAAASGTEGAVSGLKLATISITLKTPIDYKSLLNFFNMIEQSLPKLQIAKVNLAKTTQGNGVTSEVLSIAVYIH